MSHLGVQMLLCSGHHLSGPSKHAGSGPAELQVVLADPFPVEHGVEGGHLEHIHVRHLQDLGYLPHGAQRQEVVVLFLG